MRPRRLELQGFTAFRDHTEVDFDADLFAFVGPTGSGKSSLIDAMIFALYGSIPRYKNENLVAPAISQGKLEARVRLDFSVSGREYTAIRVIRRTNSGASTREARLESEGEVLAGNATELSEKVLEIIGLTFDQFTTCAVLPQGEFARFLNEKPAVRQDLLVRLLGMSVYDKIRARANAIAAEQKSRVDIYLQQVAELEDVTQESLKEQRQIVRGLKKSHKEFEKARKELYRKEKQIESLVEAVEEAKGLMSRINKLKVPKEVQQADAVRAECAAAIAMCNSNLANLAKEVDQSEKSRSVLGDLAELVELRQSLKQKAEIDKTVQSLESERKDVEQAASIAAKSAMRAKAAAEAAKVDLEATRLGEHVHVIREHLAPGDVCPVCNQTIEALPAEDIPANIRAAEKALQEAEKREGVATRAANKTEQEKAVLLSKLEESAKERTKLEGLLKGQPAAKVVDSRISKINEIDKQLKQLRSRQKDASKTLKEKEEELASLDQRGEVLWAALDAERDAFSRLKPAAINRKDLKIAWENFTAWTLTQREALASRKSEDEQCIKAVEQEVSEALFAFEEQIEELGFEIEEYHDLNDVYIKLVAETEGELKQIESDLKRKQDLESNSKEARTKRQVANLLVDHLRANRFERWVLEAAFEQLVANASDLLRELSSGQYSFAYNDKLEFEVVDHANADERRSAKTLSGGETFLASLALALTLADQVAGLAVKGAARLESMFLDEGFGTLDPDTLDVVASAIEELGSRGKMIGLVTHVTDLADRVPTQYRVTKGSSTASVERISF